MARRLNTLRLPAVIPEGSAYESSSDKENEPVPPTRAEVAAADAALKRMEAELAATLAATPAEASALLAYASRREAARLARGGQRPATMLRRSTPTAAQPYFDDDPSAGGGTLYESPVGRAVEY